MPALHRFTAVYRCAIPPLHGRDGRQRRSWATFPFDRFACMTSSSASSVPSLPVRGHRFCSNQGLPARSFWSCNSLGPAFMDGHGDERRSWATSRSSRFACMTSHPRHPCPLFLFRGHRLYSNHACPPACIRSHVVCDVVTYAWPSSPVLRLAILALP